MNHQKPITPVTFASSSDEAIVSDVKRILSDRDVSTLKPAERRMLRAKRVDVSKAGKWLWSHLTARKP